MRIPLASSAGLAAGVRRAWLIRLVLAVALATLLVGAFAAAPGGHPRSVERGGPTMAVLDVSGSIESNDFPAVSHALERAAREAGSSGAGLVLFSDSAEVALPPGTPTRELLRFRRFFGPGGGDGQPENGSGSTILNRPAKKASAATASPAPSSNGVNPWQPHFSAGTSISTGVAAARAALGQKGRIVLISDFVDSNSDRSALRQQLLAIARTPGLELQPIELPAVLPGAAVPYLSLVKRLAGTSISGAPAQRPESRPFPGWLVALAALLAAALAANELLAVSLRFREAKA